MKFHSFRGVPAEPKRKSEICQIHCTCINRLEEIRTTNASAWYTLNANNGAKNNESLEEKIHCWCWCWLIASLTQIII
jgi:hypothetical protein